MLHVSRHDWALAACASSLLALASGCAIDEGQRGATGSPPAVGAGGSGTGSVGSSGTGTGTGTGTGAGGGPTMPPIDSCNPSLPGSFTTHCSACHTVNGQANTRYPDLYKFQGT